ncbi:hypothetical protein [Duganella aceris]|jgi:hypothetical protein|uniref:DUF2622 domain-containing protein n=1 Tax=Duganella aceris TaxID=2703883 RepID=A0ABX0FJ48_9BURK|nr:hypothetical protein [Duganella aceris]NGZ84540.1 hypothetical protein [Duganella aceris]
MVNYIIRVAYTEAQAGTYDQLNTELAKYNVAGAIKADDGKGYYLPLGEYCYSGVEPINEVRDSIHRLAASIQPEPLVLVMEITTLAWSGFKLVDPV